MRAVSGRLRVDLAQYRELEAFAAFGSDLDRASQQQLARGARMVELLKQPAASPFPVGKEIVSIWAGTTGKMDDVPVEDIRRFETELLDYVGHTEPKFFDILANAKALEDDMVATLEKLVGDFRKQFQTTAGEGLSTSDAKKADAKKADAKKADAKKADAKEADVKKADDADDKDESVDNKSADKPDDDKSSDKPADETK
jgi:F-type H+-transporting ATPase subunit alpha